MDKKMLLSFLNEKAHTYNQRFFITHDPIQIPHRFEKKADIEIMAFLIATLAWGNRKSIIKSGEKLIEIMGNAPHDFVKNYQPKKQISDLNDFTHRTFNAQDLDFFISRLQMLYEQKESLEPYFFIKKEEKNPKEAIERFRNAFLGTSDFRSKKHVSSPHKNSAAKRINMYLRWMVRQDNQGVDFGIWKEISPSKLSCPLDVHSGNVARKLGLLHRKANDWKAVEELDHSLRKLNPKDPVIYDFALFGLGAFEGF